MSPQLIALIPARNESDRIAAAIDALHQQSRPPDRIVVVTNNCTDGDATREAARDAGAWVLDIPACEGKKAGALNHALDQVLPGLADTDFLLVQDADTILTIGFLEAAQAAMKRRVGAIGSVFYGESGGGLLGQLQRMEYQRYAWEIGRTGGKAVVLSGTATLFRVGVLRQIKAARLIGRIGGGSSYYSLVSLTEDDEITKAVKTLGYRPLSPTACTVTTEVMGSLVALWHQRLRWQRGALENLRDYGWTRVTAPYWAKQIMMGLGALSLAVYLLFVTLELTFVGSLTVSPFWAAIGAIFIVEKTISVRKAGWRSVVIAALLIPELLYDMFQHAVYFRSLYDTARRREERWIAT
jgi:cellulose synthase/poly-beta-1,6-N-acetylglucosamine synthase-like glycosyltransferase